MKNYLAPNFPQLLSRVARVGEAVREKGTPSSKTINALRSGSGKSIGFVMLAIVMAACEPDACEEPLSYPERKLEDGALVPASFIDLLVVPVYEANDANQPLPTTTLTEGWLWNFYFDYPNSVADFYDRNSDGNVVIEGDVYPVPVGISTECYYQQCQGFYDDLLSAAKKAIPGSEEFNAFSFLLMDMPEPDKAYSQIGAFPEDSANAGIRADFLTSGTIEMYGSQYAVHEFGHGLALLHASSYGCPGDLPINIEYEPNESCVDVYGDNTAMGGLDGDLDASQRRRLGAAIPRKIVTAPGGTFSLFPKTVPSTQFSDPEQLIFPTTGGYFSLEYNYDQNGVEVRFVPNLTSSDSFVDTVRILSYDIKNHASYVFGEGTEWKDVGRGISVSFDDFSSKKAKITVNSF